MTLTGIVGNKAENLALKYLKKKGLTLEQRNFHSRYGEIDLIMWQGQTLVFVEVRYRKDKNFGGALESVDSRKQNKLIKTAQFFLVRHNLNDTPCRFDILCVSGSIIRPEYLWVENAILQHQT